MINFYCRGHKNILATHKSTIEITKDSHLSLKGDCIVGVCSTMSLNELPLELKKAIRNAKTTIVVTIRAKGMEEVIKGKGHPDLELADENDIVIRKSNYVCPRTLMIKANKAAKDLSRDFISAIKDENARIEVVIAVL